MSTDARLELLVGEATDGRVRLSAPDAGVFTRALDAGAALAPGQSAGTLLRLGRATTLIVPAGVRGIVVSQRPERVHAPVGYGSLLYELAPFDAGEAAADALAGETEAGGALSFRAPQTGRFYARPAPDEPPFVSPGDVLEDGSPLGLIEVMKTFTRLAYRATGPLPRRARVVRVLVADGVDVDEGAPLIEVEEA